MPAQIKSLSDDRSLDFIPPTPEEMDAHLRNAHLLRSAAVQAMGRACWTWLRGLFVSKRVNTPDAEAISALTALRSSAEALRDNPDTHRDTRLRLVDIVLQEEARLERILSRLSQRNDGSVAS